MMVVMTMKKVNLTKVVTKKNNNNNKKECVLKNILENRGFDPRALSMQTIRSTN